MLTEACFCSGHVLSVLSSKFHVILVLSVRYSNPPCILDWIFMIDITANRTAIFARKLRGSRFPTVVTLDSGPWLRKALPPVVRLLHSYYDRI